MGSLQRMSIATRCKQNLTLWSSDSPLWQDLPCREHSVTKAEAQQKPELDASSAPYHQQSPRPRPNSQLQYARVTHLPDYRLGFLRHCSGRGSFSSSGSAKHGPGPFTATCGEAVRTMTRPSERDTIVCCNNNGCARLNINRKEDELMTIKNRMEYLRTVFANP